MNKTQYGLKLALIVILGVIPMYADAFVQGNIFQNPDTTDFTQGHTIFNSPVNSGSPRYRNLLFAFYLWDALHHGSNPPGARRISTRTTT
jgi:hypothetical protein